jgi:anti-sigma regulatory factor (Ser/Thr protein kinase)
MNNTIDNNFRVPFKNKISEIERLHQLVEQFCKKNNISKKTQFNLDLALEELIVNTISYGFEDDEEHEIVVNFCIKEHQLLIDIIDDGKAFNPLEKEDVNLDLSLEEKAIGGLGIHLVKTLVDEVSYKWESGKNILTLTKNIDQGEQ